MNIQTKRSLATLLLFSILTQTLALNIVVLSTIPTMSHCVIGNAMTELLLKRGHHVYELTVFPFKEPHPNRTSFVVEGGMANFDLDPSSMSVISHVGIIMYQYSWSIETCKQVLDSPATRDLLAFARDPMRPQIDVVVHSYMFHECLGPFASEFQAPFVPLSAFPNSFHMDELVGGPIFPGFIPHDYVIHPYDEPMDWFTRLESKWAYLVSLMGSHFYKYPRMDALSKAFFGENSPTVDQVRKSAPVALVNSHPAIQGARPQLPAIVQIGGFHVPPAKELPAGKIRDFLDGAKDGFVLISFGSIMSLSKMEPWRREALMRAFKRLRPLRFIMKWEVPWSEAKDGSLPDNVFLAPWIPQSDVVGHPNIRLFVTQCGGLSTVEIISHSLPIIGVPFYSDQRINANKLVSMGAGIILPYKEIDEETFYSAVRKVLDDKKYVTAVRRLSSLYHDQPETPQERAAFWVEFVARHKDARHLRSPGELMSWATRWMVDDIALAIGIVITLVYVFQRLCSRSKDPPTKTKTS